MRALAVGGGIYGLASGYLPLEQLAALSAIGLPYTRRGRNAIQRYVLSPTPRGRIGGSLGASLAPLLQGP